jgi:hypothetical protein
VFQDSILYQLFSGVCLTLIGASCLIYNQAEFSSPWRIGIGTFILLGASGSLFSAYRKIRRRATKR